MNYGYQYPAGLIITDTNAHTGRFGKVHCLSNAEVTLVADYYLDTEIPDRVKHAQVILAVYLNNNRNGLELSGLEDFAAVSIGNINVTPRFYGATGIDRIPPIVDHYLMGIRIGGRANLSIKRS